MWVFMHPRWPFFFRLSAELGCNVAIRVMGSILMRGFRYQDARSNAPALWCRLMMSTTIIVHFVNLPICPERVVVRGQSMTVVVKSLEHWPPSLPPRHAVVAFNEHWGTEEAKEKKKAKFVNSAKARVEVDGSGQFERVSLSCRMAMIMLIVGHLVVTMLLPVNCQLILELVSRVRFRCQFAANYATFFSPISSPNGIHSRIGPFAVFLRGRSIDWESLEAILLDVIWIDHRLDWEIVFVLRRRREGGKKMKTKISEKLVTVEFWTSRNWSEGSSGQSVDPMMKWPQWNKEIERASGLLLFVSSVLLKSRCFFFFWFGWCFFYWRLRLLRDSVVAWVF